MIEVKEIFEAYRSKRRKVIRLTEKLEELNSENVTSSIILCTYGSGYESRTEKEAMKIASVKSRLIIAVYDAEKMAFEIMKLLDEMDDPTDASLIFYRYLMLYPWDIVNEKMSFLRGGHLYSDKALLGYTRNKALRSFQEVVDSHPKLINRIMNITE